MRVRSTKPVKLLTRTGAVLLRPHQSFVVPKSVGTRLLRQNPDLRKVKGPTR